MGTVRSFLALSVAIGHWGPFFGVVLINAQIAVLLFFLISGFYMSMIINEQYRHIDRWRRKFILNRILRIYPTYYVVLALMIVQFTVNNVENVFTIPSDDMDAGQRVLFMILNITLVGEDIISGLIPAYDSVQSSLIPQSWTLGSEFLFYFLAPFLVLATPRKYRAIVAALALSSLALRLAIFQFPEEIFRFLTGQAGVSEQISRRLVASDPGRYRFIPTTLVMFLMGYFSYLIYARLRDSDTARNVGKLLFILVIAAGVYYIVGFGELDSPLYIADKDSGLVWSLYLFALVATPFIFLATKNSRLDDFIGALSFPIYISHIFVKQFIGGNWHRISAVRPTENEMAIMVFLLTIALSILLVYIVERPIDSYRRRVSQRARRTFADAG
ncbi:MAG: acyltransferase [Alphaproteobacteria bacterium]